MVRVPRERVRMDGKVCWVELEDPQTLMRMILMAMAEPDKAVVIADEGERE